MSTEAAARPARRRTGWRLVGYLARRALVMEAKGYQSAYRFILRRPRVPRGATGFTYYSLVLAPLVAFTVLSAVELVVVDLIVHRWTAVRIPLLIAGIWGVVFMLGLLLGILVRPHAVGPAGIRVRYGAEVDVPLAWDDVETVTARRRAITEKEPRITVDERGDATWHLRMSNETNVEIGLDRPTTIKLPHGRETVTRIALYADDPKAFMAAVRTHIDADIPAA